MHFGAQALKPFRLAVLGLVTTIKWWEIFLRARFSAFFKRGYLEIMGLFGRHEKKEESAPKRRPLPKLPDFPEMPQPTKQPAEFPRYEPSIREIKHEVARPPQRAPVAIPQRAPLHQRPTMASPQTRVASRARHPHVAEDKPLFVRIDDYKGALQALDSLKEKVAEAEKVLSGLEHLREQETQHLHKWQKELQALKSKLMTIDHSLFEV